MLKFVSAIKHNLIFVHEETTKLSRSLKGVNKICWEDVTHSGGVFHFEAVCLDLCIFINLSSNTIKGVMNNILKFLLFFLKYYNREKSEYKLCSLMGKIGHGKERHDVKLVMPLFLLTICRKCIETKL